MKKLFVMIGAVLISTSLFAQNKIDQSTINAIRVIPDKITWVDAKPPLAAGAKVAVLEGDPKKEGLFTMRLKFPPHYKIPAHTHPNDERVTVLSGSVFLGFGDKLDEKNATKFTAGSFYLNPKGIHHYAFTGDEEVVIQLTGMGPWGIEFLEGRNK